MGRDNGSRDIQHDDADTHHPHPSSGTGCDYDSTFPGGVYHWLYQHHTAAIRVLEEQGGGGWLPFMLSETWNCIMLHAKPSLLAALNNQVDTSNKFVGVDFSALKAQVPSSNQRHSSTAPPQNPPVKSEEDVPKLESEEVDMTSPSKELEEVTDATSTPTQASGVLEEGVGEEGSAKVSAP
ncbi:hypothetical protein ONZ45_g19522 [Pleurotus djamor]|nr:hypothetical protein ONZ45_g19522 [Pleurotus djamor]